MNNYNDILIIHPVDQSTQFLSEFKNHFEEYYYCFDNQKNQINNIKIRLGNLQEKNLIIYIGHGSSSGLYEPDEEGDYNNYFLDVNWGNNYFQDQDIILLSCNSSEFIKKLHLCSNSIGFGNIMSSIKELNIHNNTATKKKILTEKDIDSFNKFYVHSIIKSVKLLIDNKIRFDQIPKYIEFYINKNINSVLKNKSIENRIEIARLLFEFRNEMIYLFN
jgi:hypothetical protein